MIRVNPVIEHFQRGGVFAIDQDGCFDMDQSQTFERVSDLGRLASVSSIQIDAIPLHVLVLLSEIEKATFTGDHPLDELTIQTQRISKGFIRTSPLEGESDLTTFTEIRCVIDDETYHTPELLSLIDYIPSEQLDQFGILCLKEIVRKL